MKNHIILFGMLLLLFIVSSCEKQTVSDEISETELQLVDPDDDGAIDPQDDDRY